MDTLNKNIAKELVENPELTSREIAKNVGSPLSTVQRRRKDLEKLVLSRAYNVDMNLFGWRIADLLIEIKQGEPHLVANNVIEQIGKNFMSGSLRIGSPQISMVIQICYKSSNEILRILQDIKAIERIGRVEWSEIVQMITKGNPDVFERFEEISLHHNDDIKK
jgi:DNA-binding Lrp family transcriptional regulator